MNRPEKIFIFFIFCMLFLLGTPTSGSFASDTDQPKTADLPVIDPCRSPPIDKGWRPYIGDVTNLFDIEWIQAAIHGGGNNKGLYFDLTAIHTLVDSSVIDPKKIYGWMFIGPYPFEANETSYDYKRFRRFSRIKKGVGHISIAGLENSESKEWEKSGQIGMRAWLFLEREKEDRFLGLYDTYVNFRKTDSVYVKSPTIYEGPFVHLIRSDDPTRMTVSFKTDRAYSASVVVQGVGKFDDPEPTRHHQIEVSGLQPSREYRYSVQVQDVLTDSYTFRTAPPPGDDKPIVFGYAGDSREGFGGGERNFMGVNSYILERELNLAYQKGASFFLFGGDLINGLTSEQSDFRTQLHAWKQVASGFMRSRPIYPAIGNHESLVNRYRNAEGKRIKLDQWPYETHSAEAVFADEFVNPTNCPLPDDPRRPSYRETVYSFQYGSVKCISFNNNYWVSNRSAEFGGSPEAYLLPDQMRWLADEIAQAESDPTVKYIVLFAQEPIFPNGGHLHDAMWYRGDNNVRAYTYYPDEKLVPEPKGIIDVRNDFIRMVSQSSKAAAVLTSDEHNYSRILINNQTPVGDMTRDDPDGDGCICQDGEACSPLDDLGYPVWYLTCGGAGAPYYAQDAAPWNVYWEKYPERCLEDEGCFKFSSQYNFFILNASADKLTLEVYSPYGELIDRVDNLMNVKRTTSRVR
ncbi:MAG: hypothetical protein B6244_11660 [Candidatus Cloacimonetes bacterium 4572_55]|nr:MAG: hypothetical protein B6244_11660 [Candidatus Cloacimonetes bacterium 4572_55]